MKKPLSELDDIKMSSILKQKTITNVMVKQKTKKRPRLILMGSIACLVFAFALGYVFSESSKIVQKPADNPYAYVAFDINPSLELQLDKSNRVIGIVSYNDDAKRVLSNVDLQGYEVLEALGRLLNTDEIKTYMQSGYLQVSVYSDDGDHAILLEQEIDNSLAGILKQEQYGCSCASKSEQKSANEHHMSFGRYQIIEQIINVDQSYTMKQLESYSMRELNNLYQQLTGNQFSEEHHSEKSDHHH